MAIWLAPRLRLVVCGFVVSALAGCGSTLQLQSDGSTALGQTSTGTEDDLSTGPTAATGPSVGGGGPAGATTLPTSDSTGGATIGSGGSGTRGTATEPTRSGGGSTTASIPVTGHGWDAKHVYIGVPTADDFNTVIKNDGANFNNGSTEGDVDAIVADINRHGGLFGRQVVAVYHNLSTVSAAADPDTAAESTCTYFTQDRPVIAVISGIPQFDAIPAFHRCLEQYDTPLLSFANTDYDDADYAQLGPHLWSVASLSTDILVPSLVTALNQQHFFSGWNAQLGRPASTPAKVGILEPDTADGHHVAALFVSQLQRISVPVAAQFFYNATSSVAQGESEVLKFASAGVTHVLNLPPVEADMLFFQEAADRQHFHPRYGVTSFDLTLSVEQNPTLAPPDQQVGSMGIGWQPYSDVDGAHDPGAMPGGKRCLTALKRGGQVFTGGSDRRAAFIAVQFCDAIYLLRDAAVDGNGLSGAAILAGMPLAGPHFATAGTFSSNVSVDNHGVPGSYRYLQYQTGCSCFTYTGGNHPFAR